MMSLHRGFFNFQCLTTGKRSTQFNLFQWYTKCVRSKRKPYLSQVYVLCFFFLKSTKTSIDYFKEYQIHHQSIVENISCLGEQPLTHFLSVSYRCGNGICVSVSVLCDHHDDCLDHSDEDCCTLVNFLTLIRHIRYIY